MVKKEIAMTWYNGVWSENQNVNKDSIKQGLAKNGISTMTAAEIAAISEANQLLQPELIWNTSDNSQYFKVQRAASGALDEIQTAVVNLAYKKITSNLPDTDRTNINNLQNLVGIYKLKNITSGNYTVGIDEQDTVFLPDQDTRFRLPVIAEFGVNNIFIIKNIGQNTQQLRLAPASGAKINSGAINSSDQVNLEPGDFIFIVAVSVNQWRRVNNIGELFFNRENLFQEMQTILPVGNVTSPLNLQYSPETNQAVLSFLGNYDPITTSGIYEIDTGTIRSNNLTFNLGAADLNKVFFIPEGLPANSRINITLPAIPSRFSQAYEGASFVFKNLSNNAVEIVFTTTGGDLLFEWNGSSLITHNSGRSLLTIEANSFMVVVGDFVSSFTQRWVIGTNNIFALPYIPESKQVERDSTLLRTYTRSSLTRTLRDIGWNPRVNDNFYVDITVRRGTTSNDVVIASQVVHTNVLRGLVVWNTNTITNNNYGYPLGNKLFLTRKTTGTAGRIWISNDSSTGIPVYVTVSKLEIPA